jgi:protein TonB
MKKRDDDRQGQGKRFIELPEYPGGKVAFQDFIRKNLKYPEEALKAGIEGQVHLHYWVEGNGKVVDAEVTHGLGYGCDEEALRLVKLLRYGRIKNRGLRVKASMRTRIDFKLPARTTLSYEVKSTPKPSPASSGPKPVKSDGGTVTWTITIPPPNKAD